MKLRILLFALSAFGISSCGQHVCPTYTNSAIKYHHHQTAPSHHH